MMAYPLYLLSKKLKQHPWLKTRADRVFTVAVIAAGTVVGLNVIGFYRIDAIRSDCLASGGTPIYKTQRQEVMSRHGSVYDGLEYRTFDRCDFGK
jgi:hypothetical protein